MNALYVREPLVGAMFIVKGFRVFSVTGKVFVSRHSSAISGNRPITDRILSSQAAGPLAWSLGLKGLALKVVSKYPKGPKSPNRGYSGSLY